MRFLPINNQLGATIRFGRPPGSRNIFITGQPAGIKSRQQ
jgi:hypothetical protein